MQKMIAVAVDESLHSLQAVRYAADMAVMIPGAHFTLVHIQPAISHYLLDAADGQCGKARNELKAILVKHKEAAETLLAKCRDEMIRRGLEERKVTLRTQPRVHSVADDILALSLAESYDAILVGRRGVSYLQEVLMGSVTANLTTASRLTPIWVVDGEVSGTKVMAAVDGSTGSLRALDHLSFILSGNETNRICILHVQPRLQDYCAIDLDDTQKSAAEQIILDGDRKCMDNFHPQALKVLERNGFTADRLEFQVMPKSLTSAGKAILKAAAQQGCGTLVIGRRGPRSQIFGSVARYLSQKASGMALWVVP